MQTYANNTCRPMHVCSTSMFITRIGCVVTCAPYHGVHVGHARGIPAGNVTIEDGCLIELANIRAVSACFMMGVNHIAT